MKNIVVCGGASHDHLMTYDGNFEESLVRDNLQKVSVSYYAESHETTFGGCASNIAYSLSLFGIRPIIFTVLGNNSKRYTDWLNTHNINTDFLFFDNSQLCASFYILTDNKSNQISFFSPNAMKNFEMCMSFSCFNPEEVFMAILAPNLPERMLALANSAISNNIAYLFDPGQSITALKSEDIIHVLKHSKGLIVNDYEFSLIINKTALDLPKLRELTDFIIVTKGKHGCDLYEKDSEPVNIPSELDALVVDPTGAGDAFRSGLLYGLYNNFDLQTSCKYGIASSLECIKYIGCQKHEFDLNKIHETLKRVFNLSQLPLNLN